MGPGFRRGTAISASAQGLVVNLVDAVDGRVDRFGDRIHALMDCSDGLVNDALLLRPENCGFHLFAENLPLHTESQSLAVDLHLNPQDIVLWGGEDYELLMAIHPEDYEHFPEWKMIGQFTEDPRVFVTHPDHHEEIKEFKGWKHFPG